MKNFILLALVFSMFSFTVPSGLKKDSQNKSIAAYIYFQRTWYTGYIYYSTAPDGYKLESYSFDQMYIGGQAFSGYFYGQEKFIPLNPNNELAKQNNFTHYVITREIPIYIIAQR